MSLHMHNETAFTNGIKEKGATRRWAKSINDSTYSSHAADLHSFTQ
jgi:hypothetical protein